MNKRSEIRTLQDLRDVSGNHIVSQIFTEYLMEMVAKSRLLDQIKITIENGGSLDDIKELMP